MVSQKERRDPKGASATSGRKKKKKERKNWSDENQRNRYSDSSSRNFHEPKELLVESDEEVHYDSLPYDYYDDPYDNEYFSSDYLSFYKNRTLEKKYKEYMDSLKKREETFSILIDLKLKDFLFSDQEKRDISLFKEQERQEEKKILFKKTRREKDLV